MRLSFPRGRGRAANQVAALVGLALVVAYVLGVGAQLLPALPCPWRTLTDMPCPLCGSTATLGHLLAGDPPGAIAVNPLVAGLGLLLALALLASLLAWVLGHHVRLRLSTRERRAAWGVLVLLVLGNWAYLLLR